MPALPSRLPARFGLDNGAAGPGAWGDAAAGAGAAAFAGTAAAAKPVRVPRAGAAAPDEAGPDDAAAGAVAPAAGAAADVPAAGCGIPWRRPGVTGVAAGLAGAAGSAELAGAAAGPAADACGAAGWAAVPADWAFAPGRGSPCRRPAGLAAGTPDAASFGTDPLAAAAGADPLEAGSSGARFSLCSLAGPAPGVRGRPCLVKLPPVSLRWPSPAAAQRRTGLPPRQSRQSQRWAHLRPY